MVDMPIEDRIAVQELVHLYGFYADTKEWHAVVDLFTDDCIVDETVIGLPLMEGKDAITAYYIGGTVDMVEYFLHYVTNHIMLEYSGDLARCISYIYGVGKTKTGIEFKIMGYMNDQCAKVNGKWLFKSRRLEIFAPPAGLDI